MRWLMCGDGMSWEEARAGRSATPHLRIGPLLHLVLGHPVCEASTTKMEISSSACKTRKDLGEVVTREWRDMVWACTCIRGGCEVGGGQWGGAT